MQQGIKKGDVVCLLMPNRPEYLAFWVGVTRVGGIVALLNTNLSGPSLAHCIDIVTPDHIVVDADLSALGPTLTILGGMEKGEALVGADYRDRPDFWRLS